MNEIYCKKQIVKVSPKYSGLSVVIGLVVTGLSLVRLRDLVGGEGIRLDIRQLIRN